MLSEVLCMYLTQDSHVHIELQHMFLAHWEKYSKNYYEKNVYRQSLAGHDITYYRKHDKLNTKHCWND